MEQIVFLESALKKKELSFSDRVEVYVKKDQQASLFLNISGNVELDLYVQLEQDSCLSLLLWNESETLTLKGQIDGLKDSQMKLYLGEMSEGKFDGNVQVNLKETGSVFEMRSASVVSTHKHCTIVCTHEAAHTVSNMENYAVIYENGDYRMEDTGKIVKGAYASESHQTSRALILSDKQKCEIEPVLLIDENDVQASHATTMGQIDENQLYYLQTRGLTKTQALGLITVGYLMPIASVLDDEELEKELVNKIEKKVGLA